MPLNESIFISETLVKLHLTAIILTFDSKQKYV